MRHAGAAVAFAFLGAVSLQPASLQAASPQAASTDGATARIEARSPNFVVVGILAHGTLVIHVSRVLDNAPVHDAVVDVAFRGAAHPARAEVDGSFTVDAKELAVPGPVVVEFRVRAGGADERLAGSLAVPGGAGGSGERSTWRNMAWWVLNFSVCIGFLMVWSGRRKRAAAREAAEEAAARKAAQ